MSRYLRSLLCTRCKKKNVTSDMHVVKPVEDNKRQNLVELQLENNSEITVQKSSSQLVKSH